MDNGDKISTVAAWQKNFILFTRSSIPGHSRMDFLTHRVRFLVASKAVSRAEKSAKGIESKSERRRTYATHCPGRIEEKFWPSKMVRATAR
jgi:hypothetical protein